MGKKDKYADKKKKAEPEPTPAPVAVTPQASTQTIAPKVISHEGTKGRPLQIEVNYMQMKTDKLVGETYHYDVDFDPPGPKKFIIQALEKFRLKYFKDIVFAFDGRKNVYTNRMLKHQVVEETVDVTTEEGREKPYKLKIQYAATVDMTVLKDYKNPEHGDKIEQATQCLEIILKCRFKNTNAVPSGKQFYFPDSAKSLGDGMELWRGLHQSTVMGTKTLYVNTDVLNKAVASSCEILALLRTMGINIDGGNFPSWQMDKVTEHLKMLKIIYQIKATPAPGREPFKPSHKQFYRLAESADSQKFMIDGKSTTVQQYFKTKYNYVLKYPKLPTIQVLPADKKHFLPMEFCRIPGGQLNQKKFESREMIKQTALPTTDRKKIIMDYASQYKPNNDMKAFGVEIDSKFEKVMSRIINQPKILYRDQQNKNVEAVVNPKNGTWKEGNLVAVNPNPLRYALINCEDISFKVLIDLKGRLNAAAAQRKLGLQDSPGAENVFCFTNPRGGPRALEDFIRKAIIGCGEAGYKFVFVIVSDNVKVNDNYSMAKRIAETEVGILTQCIRPKTFFDKRAQALKLGTDTLANIFLKVNTKLNGINHHAVDPAHTGVLKSTVMFVGADVTHPPPDQKEMQASVAAVCASYDGRGSKYHPVWRLQKGGIDRIDAFEEVMLEQFKYYMKKNQNSLPSKIIYYRDGVAESQFKTFLEPEIDSMKRACRRIYGQNMLPQINVIVVNKRHHMRAFPMNPNDGDGSRFNNVLPGTVIDKDIVSPAYMQFFLASHSAIQGCTRPTKYTVILNECEINADDMEALTYCLCHMYARCNRSVSYPNCTYYAHWMADRAKKYIAGDLLDLENLQNECDNRALKDEVASNYPMFFI